MGQLGFCLDPERTFGIEGTDLLATFAITNCNRLLRSYSSAAFDNYIGTEAITLVIRKWPRRCDLRDIRPAFRASRPEVSSR